MKRPGTIASDFSTKLFKIEILKNDYIFDMIIEGTKQELHEMLYNETILNFEELNK